MPTFIKTGYWEKIQKGYKGWLNLDDVVSSSVFKTLTINTSGQSTTISNFYPAGTDGQNVYIGGGGLLGSGTGAESSYNVSLGVNALKNQTTGVYNVALGWEAGANLTQGSENILIGWQSGLVITTGFQNIFIGGAAGDAMTTGYRNTAIGNAALSANTDGLHNVAFGRSAMRYGATGSDNVAIGNDTLWNVTGNKNTALGYQAGTSAVTNANSIFIGPNSQPSANGNTNELVIGYNAVGNGSNTTVIGNTSTLSTRLHGNLLLGTNANSTYILDVNGTGRFQSDVLIKGSTSNNTATALTVQNSSSTNLFSVRNDGAVAIGSASYNDGLRINRNPTIASSTSNLVNVAIQNTVNVFYSAYRTSIGLFGSGFTLPNLSHFECINDGSFTAGVVTNLYGFRENLGTYVATNVYGFYGTIPTAAGRWNLYMNGTADNYLAGDLGIGTTSVTNWLNIGSSTTAKAHINLASGVAPTSPANGDIWFDGTDIKMRIGGVTKTFTLI